MTNFFGVNYRDLFGDVLESIERGMRDEMRRGEMREGEVEVSEKKKKFFHFGDEC